MKIKEFDKTKFISKVDNTYIMLLTSIMTNDLERVKHKLGLELYQKYEQKMNELNSKNLIQMYDEMNVKSTEISEITETEEKYIVKVKLISRYMDYRIDKDTQEYVEGINTHRIEKVNYLFFEKEKDAKDLECVISCPNCGANQNLNNTGVCPYCHQVYDLSVFDWMLVDIKE